MKRVLCLVLCLMLVIPFATAETADTLPKRFARQLTGGNGIRGYASISASGLADWLNMLLPFTATDIQIRAIGEKQGDVSEFITDDDDWQIKLYAENSAEEEVGTTWLFGNPDGVYFQSELLPDNTLSIPVKNTHLLYQFFSGEWMELFFTFDPMNMQEPGENGNPSSYEAVAKVLGISDEVWTAEWLPVLEKYFLQLDLWLASYGDPSFVMGDEAGSLKMTATYTIPAEALKAEAKYLIGQMLYDNELQNLLLPYVSNDVRMIYLNPSIIYFYNACIDALDLQGDVILSREMSALGEVVSTTVSLPIPALPSTLTDPAGAAMAELFSMENENIFKGINRVVVKETAGERYYAFSSEDRTITIQASKSMVDEFTKAWMGTMKIIPNAGIDENALSASFSCMAGHKIWQDDNYLDHDTTTFELEINPDLENLDEDDPFRSSYIYFQPIGLNFTVDYRNNPFQANSAVQVNVNLEAQMPDSQLAAEIVLRITTQMKLETFNTAGAEDISLATDERKDELMKQLIENAVIVMANLNVDTLVENETKPVVEDAEAKGEDAVAEPQAEATMVPPAAPPNNQ